MSKPKLMSARLQEKFKDMTYIKSATTRFGTKFHTFLHTKLVKYYVVKVVQEYGKDTQSVNLVNMDFTPYGGKCFLSESDLRVVKKLLTGELN